MTYGISKQWSFPPNICARLTWHDVGNNMSMNEFLTLVGQPGRIIRTQEGNVYLIGDINDTGGVCDCCSVLGDTPSSYADLAELLTAETPETEK